VQTEKNPKTRFMVLNKGLLGDISMTDLVKKLMGIIFKATGMSLVDIYDSKVSLIAFQNLPTKIRLKMTLLSYNKPSHFSSLAFCPTKSCYCRSTTTRT
jgi:hypothetical protein